MGLFDSFKRKKKEDYLEVTPPGEEGGYGPAGYPQEMPPQGMQGAPIPGMEGMQGMPPPDFPPMQQMQAPMAPQAMTPPEMEHIRQQIDAINYKIDTLKAMLDSINSKLGNIESAIKATPNERGEGWTY